MIIYVEGHGLINPSASLLIPLHPFASFSFSGAGSHLELFKSEMTSLAPITIQKNPSSLLPSLAHSGFWLPPFFPFAVAFMSTSSLSVYFFWSAGSALEEPSCDVPGSYSLVMYTLVQGRTYPKNLLSLLCMRSNGWMSSLQSAVKQKTPFVLKFSTQGNGTRELFLV